jgi:hypothetical protein
MSYKKTVILVIGIVLLVYAVFQINKTLSKAHWGDDERLPSDDSLNAEYASLIAPRYAPLVNVQEVRKRKVRNPVAYALYDSKYNFIIYKIDVVTEQSLAKIITISHKSGDLTTGIVYQIVENDFFRFQYKTGKAPPVTRILLTLAGDSIEEVTASDSILSYHLNCNNMSIRYFSEDTIDIFLVGKDRAFGRTAIMPLDILFLKRNKAVYLLLLIPKTPKESIPPNLLYNIVTGS